MNNDLKYWNKRFENNGTWEKFGGENQTATWAKLIYENTPKEINEDIKINKMSISDIGTALGQLANFYKDKFEDSDVYGFDLSSVAIKRCKENYKNITFSSKEIDFDCDVIIMSNILEHIDNPLDSLKKHIDKTNKYLIVLCPYKEDPNKLITEHVISVDETILSDEIFGAKKVFNKIMDVRDTKMWAGEMILAIYEVDNKLKEEVKEEVKVEKKASKKNTSKKNTAKKNTAKKNNKQ